MARWGKWLGCQPSEWQSKAQGKRLTAISDAMKIDDSNTPMKTLFDDYKHNRRSMRGTLEKIPPTFARIVADSFIKKNDNYKPDAFRASKRKRARAANSNKSVPKLGIKFANQQEPLRFYTVHLEQLGFKGIKYTDYFDTSKFEKIKAKLKRLIEGDFYLWFEAGDTGLAHIHFLAGKQSHPKLRALEGTKCLNEKDVFKAWGCVYYCAKVKLPNNREAMGLHLIAQALESENGKRLPKMSMRRIGMKSLRTKPVKKVTSKLSITNNLSVLDSAISASESVAIPEGVEAEATESTVIPQLFYSFQSKWGIKRQEHQARAFFEESYNVQPSQLTKPESESETDLRHIPLLM